MSYQVIIDSSQMESLLRDLRSEPSIKLHQAMAVRAEEEYKKHFYSLNASRHKSSATKGFYARTAESVTHRAYPDGFTVEIDQTGIRQRLLGGTITAGKSTSKFTGRPTKYLTIPNDPEANGKSGAEFGGLHVIWGRQRSTGRIGPIGLAAGEQGAQPKGRGKRATRGINRATAGRVLYWLVPSVTQKPDQSVLPSPSYIGAAIVDTANTYIERRYP